MVTNPLRDTPRILPLQDVTEAVECIFGPCRDLRWPADEDLGVLSYLTDKPGTNSLNSEGWAESRTWNTLHGAAGT